MSNYNFTGNGFFGIIIGLVGIGVAAWQTKKANDVANKVNMSVEDIEKKTPVDIQQDLIDEAIRKAVDREVRKAIDITSDKVRCDIRNQIDADVKASVKENLDNIKSEVGDKISEQVSKIDEQALQEVVTRKAEEKILKKFDGSLNTVLNEARDECRRRLDNVTKTYEGIADWAQTLLPRRNNSDGFNVRFGG